MEQNQRQMHRVPMKRYVDIEIGELFGSWGTIPKKGTKKGGQKTDSTFSSEFVSRRRFLRKIRRFSGKYRKRFTEYANRFGNEE